MSLVGFACFSIGLQASRRCASVLSFLETHETQHSRWLFPSHSWWLFPSQSSNIKRALRVPETRNTGQKMGGRPQSSLTTNQSQPRQQRPNERHDLAHYGGRRLDMGLNGELCHKQQTQATNTVHYLLQTRNTSKVHDQNEDDTAKDEHDDDDMLLILSQRIEDRNTPTQRPITSNTLYSKATSGGSFVALILSEPQVLFQHRCGTTSFQVAGDLSGTHLASYFVLLRALSVSFRQPGSQGPRTLALRASQRLV